MNPEKPSREEIEAKLTALLLGELPAEEAQLLRWAISQDAALAQLHDRLKLTIGFVREVAKNPAETMPAQTAPLKLSDERREKLLAHFKTVAPTEFTPLVPPLKKRREISPLLAMAAAIAIIGILAAMLLPSLAAAKRKAQHITMLSPSEEKAKADIDDIVVDQNSPAAAPPSAAPQAASEQRLESVEAYFQNGNPTSNGGDAWQNQTTIVLPASGTDEKELAAASPAPTDTVNSFGLAGGGFGGGGAASGNFQQQLESIGRRASGEAGGTFAVNGLTRDDPNGLRYLYDSGQSSVAQNQPVDQSRLYRTPVPADAADKVPTLGDLPTLGGLFRSRSVNQDSDIDGTAATPPAATATVGGIISANGTLALNGNNAYNGVTTFSGGTLNVAKDGNGYLGRVDSSQLERNRRIDQFGVAEANLAASAPAPSA